MDYDQREESANKFWSGLTGPIKPLIFGGGYDVDFTGTAFIPK